MPEPWPAPDWMRISWPVRVSSSTPTGVRATQDSWILISVGTPTTHLEEAETGNGMAHSPDAGRRGWRTTGVILGGGMGKASRRGADSPETGGLERRGITRPIQHVASHSAFSLSYPF